MLQDLTIIIPAYNEADALPEVLKELGAFCQRYQSAVILVNDGSKDSSAEVLTSFSEAPWLKVVQHKLNKGYGAAIKTGILHNERPFSVTIDADGQHDPKDILALLSTLKDQDADMVVGNRDGNKQSYYRSFGKFLLRKVAGILMELPLKDLNSGIKLYKTDLAKNYLNLCPDGMAYSDVIALVFVHQRHRVLEIPVSIRMRSGGKSTITTKTALDTFLEILNIVILFNPMRVFIPLAIFFMVSGFLWGVFIVLRGDGVSVGTLLLAMFGTMFFFLGLLAEQLSFIRKSGIKK